MCIPSKNLSIWCRQANRALLVVQRLRNLLGVNSFRVGLEAAPLPRVRIMVCKANLSRIENDMTEPEKTPQQETPAKPQQPASTYAEAKPAAAAAQPQPAAAAQPYQAPAAAQPQHQAPVAPQPPHQATGQQVPPQQAYYAAPAPQPQPQQRPQNMPGMPLLYLTGGMKFGWAVCGFFMGPIAILLAWLTNQSNFPQAKSDAVKFALIGFLAELVLIILLTVLFGAAACAATTYSHSYYSYY